MLLLEIPYPEIDPVVLKIGSLQIKWYGILFVAGFLTGNALLKKLSREGRLHTSINGVADLLVALMIGVILGGRLGFVLFYDLDKYMDSPGEVLKIWRGGLSFHGGLIGATIAIALFARKRKIPIMNVMDACAVCACPGILFVRCANFINGELWGRPTDVPWAMLFPLDPQQTLRHPSQLYEGLLEGLALFLVLWFLRNRPFFKPTGRIAGCFLVGYASLRFGIEFTREPDSHIGVNSLGLSRGQILSAAMLIGGGICLWAAGRFHGRRNPARAP